MVKTDQPLWSWPAIEARSRLIVSYLVDDYGGAYALAVSQTDQPHLEHPG